MQKMNPALVLVGLGMMACVSGGTDTAPLFETGVEDTDTDTDTDADTDTDTDVEVTTPYFTEVGTPFVTCTEKGDDVDILITAKTANWGYNASVYMAQTGVSAGAGWAQEDMMTETDSSKNPTGKGAYSFFELSLEGGGDGTVDGETFFTCEGITTNVTFATVVFAEDGKTVSDCAVWGDDAKMLIGGDNNTDASSADPVPSWLTSDNCNIVK